MSPSLGRGSSSNFGDLLHLPAPKQHGCFWHWTHYYSPTLQWGWYKSMVSVRPSVPFARWLHGVPVSKCAISRRVAYGFVVRYLVPPMWSHPVHQSCSPASSQDRPELCWDAGAVAAETSPRRRLSNLHRTTGRVGLLVLPVVRHRWISDVNDSWASLCNITGSVTTSVSVLNDGEEKRVWVSWTDRRDWNRNSIRWYLSVQIVNFFSTRYQIA